MRAARRSPSARLKQRDVDIVVFFEDHLNRHSDLHVLGRAVHDIRHQAQARLLFDLDDRDHVGQLVLEDGVDGVVDERAALDAARSRTRDEDEVRPLARVAEVVGRVLRVTTVLAELDLDAARREEGSVIRRQGRQDPFFPEVTAHAFSPVSSCMRCLLR